MIEKCGAAHPKNEKVLNNGMVVSPHKACESEPDASGGWRLEYFYQMVESQEA